LLHLTLIIPYLQASLLEQNIKPRTNLPPLLVHLRERQPEKLHYIGVSFGLTQDLFRFWRKRGFAPFYIGQIPVKIIFLFLFIPLCMNYVLTKKKKKKKKEDLIVI
jgi:preprotein translocase subunit SecG